MPKKSTQYVCNNCGDKTAKWSGKCNSCGEWNTLVVSNEVESSISAKPLSGISLDKIQKANTRDRLKTGLANTDLVLGGGIVEGSLCLLAGEPGIGKSTLLLQIAEYVARKKPVLYISGEESVAQIGLRADRLKVGRNLELVNSNNTNEIASTILSKKYSLVIVDSIQTMNCDGITTSAGSISQVTNSTQMLLQATKNSSTATLVAGHVTKEGTVAGPKLLEHMVDCVLSLEGEKSGGFKLLKSSKNRFGSTSEVAIYEMHDIGLVEIDNPSQALLNERTVEDGSVVFAAIEGSRSILVEIQALVGRSTFGYPKRAASGFDLNRLNLLVAVLNQRTKLDLSSSDIFINVVGGIKINEPAADLAICMAIASAAKSMKLKKDAVVFGEVGLSGEIRSVSFPDKRIKEAIKMKFPLIIGPKSLVKNSVSSPVDSLKDALNKHLEGR